MAPRGETSSCCLRLSSKCVTCRWWLHTPTDREERVVVNSRSASSELVGGRPAHVLATTAATTKLPARE